MSQRRSIGRKITWNVFVASVSLSAPQQLTQFDLRIPLLFSSGISRIPGVGVFCDAFTSSLQRPRKIGTKYCINIVSCCFPLSLTSDNFQLIVIAIECGGSCILLGELAIPFARRGDGCISGEPTKISQVVTTTRSLPASFFRNSKGGFLPWHSISPSRMDRPTRPSRERKKLLLAMS